MPNEYKKENTKYLSTFDRFVTLRLMRMGYSVVFQRLVRKECVADICQKVKGRALDMNACPLCL